MERQRAERAPGSSERSGRLPDHDVAFDTGLLTVGAGLQIHLSKALANAVRGDPLAGQYYGRPPLLERLLLPDDAQQPARKYLNWHKTKVFIASSASGPAAVLAARVSVLNRDTANGLALGTQPNLSRPIT